MKLKIIFLLLISMIQVELFAEKTTTQTATTNISSHPNKTMDELKAIVLQKAKLQAAYRIYGELLVSHTNVEDGKIGSEKINNITGGIIRIKGDPQFQNGVNLGDIQVTIEAYATDQDIKKYNESVINIPQSSSKTENKVVQKKDFYGEWSGYIMDKNHASVKVMISIASNGQSKIDFSSKNCGGDLLVKHKDIHNLEFKKVLNFGKNNCEDKTKIVLIRNSDSKLTYIEYNADHEKIMHGSLYREY